MIPVGCGTNWEYLVNEIGYSIVNGEIRLTVLNGKWEKAACHEYPLVTPNFRLLVSKKQDTPKSAVPGIAVREPA